MSMKIGKASYGGQKRNYYKLKDGDTTFRILPPLGDLADDGRWSMFYNVHYGYKNSKGQMRAFQSPLVKNRKTKMIEKEDAALRRIETLKAQLEKAKAENNGPLVERLGKLVGMPPKVMGQYNLESRHYMNVVDQQGNIGVLKIPHRAKLALDATIKALRDKNIDPLSVDDGRFFVFSRSGMGLDTTFQVSLLKKTFNIAGVGDVEQDVVHKLDESLINRLSKEAAQLDKLFKRPSSEDVARIVAEGAPAVDEILDAKSEETSEEAIPEEYEEDSAPAQAAPVAAPVQTQAAPVVTPAPKAESLAAAPKTTAQSVAEQSDDDFLKSLGI